MNILQKISWKFRKTHITITPLIISINHIWDGWGFSLLNIQIGLFESALIKLSVDLPNGADRKLRFSGDFLFLRNHLLKMREDLDDDTLWNPSGMSKLDTLKLSILNFIFK